MTLWYFVSLTILLMVIRFVIIALWLLRLRNIAQEYNGYIHQQYTQSNKPTPPLLGRIQYEKINRYNECLRKRHILKRLFKPLPVRGEVPACHPF